LVLSFRKGPNIKVKLNVTGAPRGGTIHKRKRPVSTLSRAPHRPKKAPVLRKMNPRGVGRIRFLTSGDQKELWPRTSLGDSYSGPKKGETRTPPHRNSTPPLDRTAGKYRSPPIKVFRRGGRKSAKLGSLERVLSPNRQDPPPFLDHGQLRLTVWVREEGSGGGGGSQTGIGVRRDIEFNG